MERLSVDSDEWRPH